MDDLKRNQDCRLTAIVLIAMLSFCTGLLADDEQEANLGGDDEQQIGVPPETDGTPEPPLRRLFRGLLGQQHTREKETEKKETEEQGRHRELRLEDRRAPYQEELAELLDRGDRRLKEGDPAAAIQSWQQILDGKEDALFPLKSENGKTPQNGKTGVQWQSIRELARRRLCDLPADERRRYVERYGGLAEKLLEEGDAGGGAAKWSEAARYFPTPSGQTATDRLATWHLDRGEFVPAAQGLKSLSDAKAGICDSTTWKLKALWVAYRVGDTKWGEELEQHLAGIDSSDFKLGGTAVTLESLQRYGKGQGRETKTTGPELEPSAEPTLSLRWSGRLYDSDQIRTLSRENYQKRLDQKLSTEGASQPLVVGDRIITRGWRGIEVRDRKQGELLWRAADRRTPEEILLMLRRGMAMRRDEFERFNALFPQTGQLPGGDEGASIESVLAGLWMYYDGNSGILTSDGKRLFAVEEQPLIEGIPSYLAVSSPDGPRDLFGRIPTSNQLAAYELTTGREAWRIGGESMEDPFAQELRGWFFRGAPVSDNHELLAIAERQGEIRLLSIDPERGRLLRSQLLGYSSLDAGKDPLRERMSLQPMVTEGLIICPTTTNWIVAIDRMTHSLVWHYRLPFSETNSSLESEQMIEPSGLARGWKRIPLLARDGCILWTTMNGKQLKCLNSYDGRVRWSLSSKDWGAVAGTIEGAVVIVTRKSAYCLGLEDRTRRWELDFKRSESVGGRGILTDKGMLYLPTEQGDLLAIETREGKLVGRLQGQFGAAETPGLGSLTLTGDELISVNGEEVRAFETRASIEKIRGASTEQRGMQVQRRILEGEELVRDGKFGEAWKAFREILRNDLPEEQRQALEQRQRVILLAGLRAGEETPEWETYLQSALPEEKPVTDWELAMAGSDWLAARDRRLEAWEFLMRQVSQDGIDEVYLRDEEKREARVDLIIGERLKRLWTGSQEAERTQLDKILMARLPEFATSSSQLLTKWTDAFRFHPLSEGWKDLLLEKLISERKFQQAERLLLEERDAAKQTSSEAATRQTEKLNHQFRKLMTIAGVPEDADWFRPDSTVTHDRVGDKESEAVKSGVTPNWGGISLAMTNEGDVGAGFRAMEIPIPPEAPPSIRRHRLELSTLQQRFVVRNHADDRIEWSETLRTLEPMSDSRGKAWFSGHMILVEFEGLLQGISMLDHRRLWSEPIRSASRREEELIYSDENSWFPIEGVELLSLKLSGLKQQLPPIHLLSRQELVARSSSRICLREGVSLTCRDATTGKKVWSLGGVTSPTAVIGGGELIYLIHSNTFAGEIRRLRDGSLVRDASTSRPLSCKPLLDRTLRIYQGDLIQRERLSAEEELQKAKVSPTLKAPLEDLLRTQKLLEQTELTGGITKNSSNMRLFRYRPETGETLWTAEVPADARVGEVSPGNLLIVEETGDRKNPRWKLRILSLDDGAMRDVGEMDPRPIRSLRQPTLRILAFQDAETLYVAVNRNRQVEYSEDLVSKLEVDGPLGVFDLAQGKLAWQANIRSMSLILEKLDRSPVLIFTDRSFPLGGNGQWKRDVRVLDRTTGREMLNQQVNSDDQLLQVELNPRDRSIRLICSRQVLRLKEKKSNRNTETK